MFAVTCSPHLFNREHTVNAALDSGNELLTGQYAPCVYTLQLRFLAFVPERQFNSVCFSTRSIRFRSLESAECVAQLLIAQREESIHRCAMFRMLHSFVHRIDRTLNLLRVLLLGYAR